MMHQGRIRSVWNRRGVPILDLGYFYPVIVFFTCYDLAVRIYQFSILNLYPANSGLRGVLCKILLKSILLYLCLLRLKKEMGYKMIVLDNIYPSSFQSHISL